MRVLYVSRGYTPHDRRFLLALTGAGHTVGLLRTEDAARGAGSVPEGVVGLTGSIENALLKFEPHVTQAGPVPTIAYLAAKANAHPLVAVSWGSDLLDLQENRRADAKFALEASNLFLCDSLEVAAAAKQISGIADNRIVEFPWGVELARFRPAPVRPAVMHLISTRSWEPGYGIETVLAAFAAARKSEPQLCLTLFGGGSLEARIRRFLVKNKLTQAVEVHGRVDEADLPIYLTAADVYVSAAPVDGSSISQLEALATGLPVIATDRRSNREWITPGINGWLAHPGDVHAFSQAMIEAAHASFDQRESMRAANLALARSRADWSRHAATYLRAIDSVACSVPA
jgi:glycosyltransferase involved in cell wall biosynthesis